MGNIGVIVVSYHSAEVLGECLEACLRQPEVAEIVVVDNASPDGSVAEASRRGVRSIANPENRGFAAAVNQGVRALNAPLLLVLNPDTTVVGGLDAMAEACSRPGVGACGGLLVDGEGLPQLGFCVRAFPTPASLAFEVLGINRLWPGNPVNRRYRCAGLDLGRECEVDQPAGAFLMFRRETWERVGGFDESFRPIWFEDVDFCLRLRAAGSNIRYTPLARASHAGAHSIRNISRSARALHWYGSLLKYAAKHFPPIHRRGVALSVILAAWPRALAGALLERNARPLSVYSRVIAFAFRAVFAPRALAVSALRDVEPVCGRVTPISTQDHLHGL